MKKNTPEFLKYLSSLSVSLTAATVGLVPVVATAAPTPEVQAEIRLSPEAATKLQDVAEQTLFLPDEALAIKDKEWLLWAQWGVDNPSPDKVEAPSVSFMDALAQVGDE